MRRPRPSKSESSWGRAVGPGLFIIPAGLAGAVGANGWFPGPDGLGASPVQAGPASDATDPGGPDSISGGMPAVRRNGAVSCVNGTSNGSNVRPIRDRMMGSAPYAESPTRNWGVRVGPSLTPCMEAPCADDSASLPRRSLPKRVEPVTDARFPDRWLTNRQVLGLTADAFRLFVIGNAWAVSNRTDGRLDATDLAMMPDPAHEHDRAQLTGAGLWNRTADGYEIAGFATVQTTAAQLDALEQKRAQDRERQARHRTSKRESPRDVTRDTEARQEPREERKNYPANSDDEMAPDRASRLDALARARTERGWEA